MMTSDARTIGGRALGWMEGGAPTSSNVLVWLHAFPLSGAMWMPQLEALPGWRVLAPDLAGFGRSVDHRGVPTIEDFARDLFGLLDALGLERVVVGGLSMGGYAAIACQHLAPSRVRAFIFADTRSAADTAAARVGRDTMLGIVESRGAPGVADEMLPKLVGATTHRTRPGLVAQVRALIEANSPDGIGRAVKRLRDRPDRTGELAGIAVPVLVIVGEEDAITPVDDSRALAAAIPDATLAILPLAGHLSNLENPDSFNRAVRPWLEAL
jgi:pimeloyl-ACP methyl ester carboxylesterase